MTNGTKVLWAISMGAAFFCGYFVNSTSISNLNSNQHNESSIIKQPVFKGSEIKVKDNVQLREVTQLEKVNVPVATEIDLNILIDDLKKLLDGEGFTFDMSSIAEAYGLIENLTEDELLTTLHLMKGELNKTKNITLLSLLTGQLATFDPIKTLSFIEEYIDIPQAKKSAVVTTLSKWAKEDPESAYYWYINPNNDLELNNQVASVGLFSIFNGLALRDANSAFDKLTELDSSNRNTRMAIVGFSQSLENKDDFIQFIERSEQLDNPQIKASIITTWVSKNPLESIEWSDSIQEQEQQQKMQSSIFKTWSNAEPTDAANWYIEKADESEKQSYATQIIRRWGMKDPNAALTWLDQQTTFDTQKSVAKLLSSSSYQNPQFTIDNIERLTNDKDKADMSFKIYSSLERSSTKKAAEFLTSSPYKEEIVKQQQRREMYRKKNGSY